jgi:hypothetical protein
MGFVVELLFKIVPIADPALAIVRGVILSRVWITALDHEVW